MPLLWPLPENPTISIVDDDPAVRDHLPDPRRPHAGNGRAGAPAPAGRVELEGSDHLHLGTRGSSRACTGSGGRGILRKAVQQRGAARRDRCRAGRPRASRQMSFRGHAIGRVDGPVSPAQATTRPEDSVPERARTDQAIVYVVDDEPSIRNSTKELVESVG